MFQSQTAFASKFSGPQRDLKEREKHNIKEIKLHAGPEGHKLKFVMSTLVMSRTKDCRHSPEHAGRQEGGSQPLI